MPATLLNTEQAAARIGLKSSNALRARYRRCPETLPPAIRIGRLLFWHDADIDHWIDDLRAQEQARLSEAAGQ